MILTILITVSVTLWCLFSFVLYGYHYLLEVILDLPIVGDSPCSAHSALKLIVQKIIREAKDLPKLENELTNNTSSQENRTYEDLLSTAILNKIISSSQNNLDIRSARSSRANSVCSHRSTSSRRRNLHKEYFFGEETLDNKWKNVDTDTASVSSFEEWVQSDSSLGSTKYVDKVSLTIKHRIEEVPSSDSDSDEPDADDDDDAEYFQSKNPFENDEPNWFLQKRQFLGGTSSPVPVPMLVPDPTTEAKVLIGDKEIDDTSDLSDVPSDFDDGPDDRSANLGIKTRLLESRSLIGGKNPLADLNVSCQLSDDEISADSGVKECKDFDEVDSEAFSTSNRNEAEYAVGESLSSDCSNTERDTEYTEKYATLPRTILVSPKNNRIQENGENDSKMELDTSEIDSEENKKEFPTGLYSKREKEKWKHAVELKNNPYSKENIEKRIKSRNSFNSQFGSDYYMRQARLPSGAKRTEVESSDTLKTTDLLVDGTDEKYSSDVSKQDTSPLTPTKNLRIPENLQEPSSPEASPVNHTTDAFFPTEITSDSDASIVNCYDVKESVIYRKLTANEIEEIQSAEKYLSFESTESPMSIVDNNTSSEPKSKETELKPVAKPRKKMSNHLETPKKDENVGDDIVVADPDSTRIAENNAVEDSTSTRPFIINKRSDNTLIRKIYSNPSVRSFALNTRSKLPTFFAQVNNQERIAEVKETSTKPEPTPTIPIFSNYDHNNELNKINVSNNFSRSNVRSKSYSDINRLENSSQSKMTRMDCNSDAEAVEEIIRLKQKKLVANRLRQISKSSGNLSAMFDETFEDNSNFEKSELENGFNSSQNAGNVRRLSGLQSFSKSTSVKDLRKRFETIIDTESKTEKNILYSLTGRSISKQFKEKLRKLDEDSPSLSQIHSLSLTNLEVEDISR